MKKPIVDEIRAYWMEANLHGDPDEFFDHFTSNGWKVGHAPMQDWQAAARNWSRREWKSGKAARAATHIQHQPGPSDSHVPTDEELAKMEADAKAAIDRAYAERATKP